MKILIVDDASFVYEIDMSYLQRISLVHRLETWKELATGACEKAMEAQV